MRFGRTELLGLSAILLRGCATQPSGQLGGPGFLLALWHGFIAPIALIGVLLHWLLPDTAVGAYFAGIRVYAWPNSGPLYDLGFLLGLSAWGGGAAAATRGGYDDPEDELQEAQDRVRRLRRKIRQLIIQKWNLRDRGHD